MSDIGTLTAAELLASYGAKRLSPVEVTKFALDRIHATASTLNAFYVVQAEAALSAARESERRWHRGAPMGLLDGIPTSVKDALALEGTSSYRGSAATEATAVPSQFDAPCVSRMKEHGAIILGKTTMPDFGMLASGYSSKHGITRNPWDPASNPGGSSSGAAASVAVGISPLVVGTDIVGSIRVPASFCALVGHKPSQGRVPYYPPASPSLVAGPMARTVDDAALLLDVICQPDPRDFTALPACSPTFREQLSASIRDRRFGLLLNIGFGPEPDGEVIAHVRAAARAIQQLGASVVEIQPPFCQAQPMAAEAFYRTRCYTELSRYSAESRSRARVIETWANPASRMSAVDQFTHYSMMQADRERTLLLMDGLDFLLLPTVPTPPYDAEWAGPGGDRIFDGWCNTYLFNVSEQPAISINCGFSSERLPIGLQIVGRRFDDLGVLQAASAYERARGPIMNWPTP